ncbi:hypothetical protein B0H19DRAFT_1239697 [Mycena capillaripes]|nr:hypothetical protein B0H19DRAFT_1239697 [Mycena capillaripes]
MPKVGLSTLGNYFVPHSLPQSPMLLPQRLLFASELETLQDSTRFKTLKAIHPSAALVLILPDRATMSTRIEWPLRREAGGATSPIAASPLSRLRHATSLVPARGSVTYPASATLPVSPASYVAPAQAVVVPWIGQSLPRGDCSVVMCYFTRVVWCPRGRAVCVGSAANGRRPGPRERCERWVPPAFRGP